MSDDETEVHNHKQALEDWVARSEQEINYEIASFNRSRDVSNALYAFSERSLLLNLESIDMESALRVWAVIETARREGFPSELGM